MASLVSILGADWSPPPPRLIDPPELQLYKAIQDAGLEPPDEIILDGNLRRFRSGTKGSGGNGDKTGWVVAFSDGIPAGRFGCWRAGVEHSWRADVGRTITPAEEMAHARRMGEAKLRRDEERKRSQEIAADTVDRIFAGCTYATADHPYLVRKGIGPNGARVTGDGRLVVPLFDSDGALSSVQYISDDGSKLYHPGGKTGEAYWTVGAYEGGRLYIAEGFATAATIYETTGRCCVVAYSASNLPGATAIFRERYPDAQIVIVADHDKGGIGQKYADQAAARYGAQVIMPPVPEMDANDYQKAGYDLAALLEPAGGMKDKLRAVYASDLSSEFHAPDELIENLMVIGALTVIYGDSNCGKTFLALSMAASIAEGEDWFGRRTDPGLVIYLATESPASVIRRVQAIKKFYGWTLENLVIVQCPLSFYASEGDALDVIELVKQVEIERQMPTRMIVGDTLARLSAGANENSGEDMGPVMARFDRLTHASKAAMLLIHHNGKNQAAGARGWSGIRAHIDTEIEIKSEGDARSLSVTKQRELGGKGDEIGFRLEVVELGTSKFGGTASTCVAVPSDVVPVKKDSKYDQHRKLLEAKWFACGAEERDGRAYIGREKLRASLLADDKPEATVRNMLKPGETTRLIGSLLVAEYIAPFDQGWIVINGPASAALLSRKKKPD
jgi:phage/plasmid primase-like uncharacterized protein